PPDSCAAPSAAAAAGRRRPARRRRRRQCRARTAGWDGWASMLLGSYSRRRTVGAPSHRGLTAPATQVEPVSTGRATRCRARTSYETRLPSSGSTRSPCAAAPTVRTRSRAGARLPGPPPPTDERSSLMSTGTPAPAHGPPTDHPAHSVRAALRSPRMLRTEVLGGLVVALALIPEAISDRKS